jgi:GMP synthase (glutamine-hydrolysing)
MGKILILDFGGQYCHLISRRLKDLKISSHIAEPDMPLKQIKQMNLSGIILSGGAASVFDGKSPKCSREIMDIGVPVLGICYGHQLIASFADGKISEATSGEYGTTELNVSQGSKLLKGLKKHENVWMNHRDIVKTLPIEFNIVARTKNSPVAAFENHEKQLYGVQFHPEVVHTPSGNMILENFAVEVCKAEKSMTTKNLIEEIIRQAKDTIGNKKAIMALSGGIDSTVAAVLVNRAIGNNLTAIYVDTGLMRQGETESVEKAVLKYNINFRVVDGRKRFFSALKGVTDPEQKRKIIGKLFIEIFEEEAKMEKSEFLVQGTIYSDRIESGITKNSSVIKSHHNVGGLPEKMKMKLYEPLQDLYKDEVRVIARKIGLSDYIINRQVFPGPGLAIRIVGEVTPERAEIVRKASHIIEEEVKNHGISEKIWMAFAVLLPVKSVGIQGDERSYKYPVVVRLVESKDAMTANFSQVPYKVLEKISTRIINEVKEVNRVVYDITNKPPASMEWE